MDDSNGAREAAIKRLKAKRDFKMHVGSYLIINVMLVGIWALTSRGHFWPIWVMVFWGVGLAFHGWDTYFGRSFSEDEIRREMGEGQ